MRLEPSIVLTLLVGHGAAGCSATIRGQGLFNATDASSARIECAKMIESDLKHAAHPAVATVITLLGVAGTVFLSQLEVDSGVETGAKAASMVGAGAVGLMGVLFWWDAVANHTAAERASKALSHTLVEDIKQVCYEGVVSRGGFP